MILHQLVSSNEKHHNGAYQGKMRRISLWQRASLLATIKSTTDSTSSVSYPSMTYLPTYTSMLTSDPANLCTTCFCDNFDLRNSTRSLASLTSTACHGNLSAPHLWSHSPFHGGLIFCVGYYTIKLPSKIFWKFTHQRFHCIFLWLSDNAILWCSLLFVAK